MQLSYICRILCVAICSAGLLQAAMEYLAWRLSAFVTTSNGSNNARSIERQLFFLALVARLAPFFIVASFLLPSYVRGEDNVSTERVGIATIALCAFAVAWSAGCVLRLLFGMWKMRRYCRSCHEIGQTQDGAPILLHPGNRLLLAVAGVFSYRIIISQGALDRSCFSDDTLDTAFAHESAHIRHRDNLKLMLLSILPHIKIGTSNRPSLQNQWRLYAELAADEEGVQGEQGRSLLLAEMLLKIARDSNRVSPSASIALISREEDLRIRVDRLLHFAEPNAPSTPITSQRSHRTIAVFMLFVAACVVVAYACARLGHPLAEGLLRLG
jgi:hypothetical protein